MSFQTICRILVHSLAFPGTEATSSKKKQVLHAKEREQLTAKLKLLDQDAVFAAVEAIVSTGSWLVIAGQCYIDIHVQLH